MFKLDFENVVGMDYQVKRFKEEKIQIKFLQFKIINVSDLFIKKK